MVKVRTAGLASVFPLVSRTPAIVSVYTVLGRSRVLRVSVNNRSPSDSAAVVVSAEPASVTWPRLVACTGSLKRTCTCAFTGTATAPSNGVTAVTTGGAVSVTNAVVKAIVTPTIGFPVTSWAP